MQFVTTSERSVTSSPSPRPIAREPAPRRQRVPRSTYRLQISDAFDFGEATDVVAYLHDLGIDWLYLSPLLSAPDSEHGYDVVDHDSVDEGRGGRRGFERLATTAHGMGLGVLVDIVPNHVAVDAPLMHAWWRDVLENGQGSRFAEAFDIDWAAGAGRVRLPILGDDPDALEIVGTELRYHEHRLPLRPDTVGSTDSVEAIVGQQHYELIHWRRADTDLNYRRFFAVSSLAAIRVEEAWVFEESHSEIISLIEAGYIDGLRVDHPDGLVDPGAYLDRLSRRTGGVYTVVEKILEGDEQLPASWEADGTTGYDALGDIDRVLIDPSSQPSLDALVRRLQPSATDWDRLVHDCKREVADGILNAEIQRIARDVERRVPDGEFCHDELVDAIAEVASCFGVYRSYLPEGIEHLDRAFGSAAIRRPDLGAALSRLHPTLADSEHPAAQRFQQTTGMVMAKGVEDRAFYRSARLGALTEVGGDPAEYSLELAGFHQRQILRQARTPASMTTLTTHDTKRSEDVRARLDVLSELPEVWSSFVSAVAPKDAVEMLVWQAIIGTWPATRERLHDYAVKAAREAGLSTSWTDVDTEAEERLTSLVDLAFDDAATQVLVEAMVASIRDPGRVNSLSAKLLQLTMPGVPDVYQGSELWESSLVDPDNRRAVDFAERRRLLAEIDGPGAPLPPIDDSGRAKLLVTSRALRARRDRPELFTRYVELAAQGGPAARHLVGFDRGGAITLATRLPLALRQLGGWADTTVVLPSGPYRDVVSGRQVDGGVSAVADLLSDYPVALLLADEAWRADHDG